MEAKHTPGRWWFDDDGFIYADTPGASGIQRIADPHCEKGIDPDEREANGHLIAAAPQLLEALRKMRKRFDPIDLGVDDEEACDLADAAIRAAEGGGV